MTARIIPTTTIHYERYAQNKMKGFLQLNCKQIDNKSIQITLKQSNKLQSTRDCAVGPIWEGYNPIFVPVSMMKRAPSRRYRASVSSSTPSLRDTVLCKSFFS